LKRVVSINEGLESSGWQLETAKTDYTCGSHSTQLKGSAIWISKSHATSICSLYVLLLKVKDQNASKPRPSD
jgi:hypothetical protein